MNDVSRRDEDLTHGLVITVIAGATDSIAATIAHRFEVEESMLVLRPFGPARFLLILLSSEHQPSGPVPAPVLHRSPLTSTPHPHVLMHARLGQLPMATIHVAPAGFEASAPTVSRNQEPSR